MLSIHAADGEIYGFIGHNGAGKTAAIRRAAGILPFEGGKIWINGTDIRKDPLLVKRQTAYLPDNPDLYDNMSGKAYLNFIADVSEDRWKEKIRSADLKGQAAEVYHKPGSPFLLCAV